MTINSVSPSNNSSFIHPLSESFSPEDLVCPITQSTIRKVAILVECGHCFDDASVRIYFKNKREGKCPLCRKEVAILPSREDIQKMTKSLQKMVEEDGRRLSIQIACDRYYVNHPEEVKAYEEELRQTREMNQQIRIQRNYLSFQGSIENGFAELFSMAPHDLNKIRFFLLGATFTFCLVLARDTIKSLYDDL